ncbi:histidinol-phosphatase [Rhodoluna lacicola]|uniref:histidinol-phosphatase n=1 Tax=Rhodoluna lacicola TaxID=529884 RepID=UPI00222E2032|nr:histidinol-phosphatase [Rhodoluna lacicola]BDS50658.1 histidinol-phosphatase [Rhodoluna lacicola]
MNYQADLNLALELADIADAISLQRFRALDLHVEDKPDRSPVTDADRSVEQALKKVLAEKAPADALIGEEYGNSGSASRTWIIDPIDGTANYLRGVPIWATLIALAIDGKPVVSVVSAPAMGRRWWAAPEVGAFTRDIDGSTREIKVSAISELDNASLSYNNLQLWDQAGLLPELTDLSRKIWRTRAYGDFWSYMLLAEGSVDIVAEHDLKIYDIAALVPIVEQAGGKFTALNGPLSAETSSVVATNSKLHDSVQKYFS